MNCSANAGNTLPQISVTTRFAHVNASPANPSPTGRTAEAHAATGGIALPGIITLALPVFGPEQLAFEIATVEPTS
jgi:hypothetical protein